MKLVHKKKETQEATAGGSEEWLGQNGGQRTAAFRGGWLTILGQDHLLHVGHRSGVLHVFG